MPIFLLGIGIIYLFGAVWLGYVLNIGIQGAVVLVVVPFIAVDIVKAIATSFIATAVVPKERYCH